jgi:hypothetical protein
VDVVVSNYVRSLYLNVKATIMADDYCVWEVINYVYVNSKVYYSEGDADCFFKNLY